MLNKLCEIKQLLYQIEEILGYKPAWWLLAFEIIAFQEWLIENPNRKNYTIPACEKVTKIYAKRIGF